jgi:hypothetical protein
VPGDDFVLGVEAVGPEMRARPGLDELHVHPRPR